MVTLWWKRFMLILPTLCFPFLAHMETLWDDNHDPRAGQTKLPSSSTSTSSIDHLFDSSPCYLNHCDDSIIEAIRQAHSIEDKIHCLQLDTQCHCCLRQQLNRAELDNLYSTISSYLNIPKPKSTDKLCKVLNCDDYQVRAIRSSHDPNGECHPHGDNECECCVQSHVRKNQLNNSSSSTPCDNHNHHSFNGSKFNSKSKSSTHPFNLNSNPLDLESNFFHLFSPSKSYPPNNNHDSSSSSSLNSPSSSLFDVDCVHHHCNGPQVKAIRRLPSQVIACIKMGNSDNCKCCFNSSLSIFERVKYEIELTNINNDNRGSTNPKDSSSSDSATPYPLPPSLSRRSPSYYSSSSPASSSSSFHSIGPTLDCSLHHCKSDLVQLVRSIPTHIVSCKPVKGYLVNGGDEGHCRCCVDSSLTDLNLRNFLQFLNL